jgi:diguanylate cyclase (GGDEF)-like protein
VSDQSAPADLAELLAQAAAVVAAGTDLEPCARRLVEGAAGLTGAHLGAVFTREPDGTGLELRLLATAGFAPDAEHAFVTEVQGDPGHPIAVAAREGRPALGRVGTRPDGSSMTGADLPLTVTRDGIDLHLGVVSFGWPGERRLDEATGATLRAVADLLAIAIDRARLASLGEERSEWHDRIAGLDLLTGLANRRTLDRVLELEIERAKRQQSDISVAVFDVDGFRAVNERSGTGAGDDVLRAVAAVLAEQVRLVDTVARVGGDEFVVVAPGSGGIAVADRILRSIDALEPVGGASVSVSAGVARFPADGTSAEELLNAALAALQGARESGTGAIAEVRVG